MVGLATLDKTQRVAVLPQHVIFTRDFFLRPGIRRETATGETNTLTSQMFTNPSHDHAQHVASIELSTVRKAVTQLALKKKTMKVEVVWSKRL